MTPPTNEDHTTTTRELKGEHVTDRAQTLTDLDVIVAELLDEVTTSTLVVYAATGQAPRQDGRPTPKRVRHQTTGLGLYVQLEQASGARPTRTVNSTPTPTPGLLEAGYTNGPRYGAEPTAHAKPGSRPPMSLESLDLLAMIDTAAVELRRRADKAAGIPTLAKGRGFRGELQHLGWLLRETNDTAAPLLSDVWPRRVYSAARSWAADARVALSYLAPIQTLRVTCPDCGGKMHVRADASSDVWCSGTLEGPALEDDPWPVRCGAVWPRFTWVQLLDTATETA